MTETRQGEVERGYSMTLSRMFDPVTMASFSVCFDAERRPNAFNQYIPARAIEGTPSTSCAGRTLPTRPRVDRLRDHRDHQVDGRQRLPRLGLNFATMRAVVAGEDNGGPWRHMERSVLHRFSDTMQIESLWVFNKKYGPEWRPATSSPTRRATRRVPDLPSPGRGGHRVAVRRSAAQCPW